MVTLSEFLRTHRDRLGMTQAALSDAIQCERSFIANMETGRSCPSADVLDRLCSALSLGSEERSDALRLAAEAARARSGLRVITPPDEIRSPADEVLTPDAA